METSNFVFDIIVTHLDTLYMEIEDPKKLQVDVQFNNRQVRLTASRINVNEFKTGGSTEFTLPPMRLREVIEQCGMRLIAKYNFRVIGSGQINFPQSLIETIDEGMTDLVHMDSCNIENNGKVVGSVEMLCRLVIKCDDHPKLQESECRRKMDKSINPQDIMFVLNESQRCPFPCDPCLDTWQSEEGDDRLKLDLLRYSGVNSYASRPNEIFTHSPTGNAACCEIQKMAKDFEQIIDSITKRSGQPQTLKPPCQRHTESNSSCSGASDVHPEENQLSAVTVPCFTYSPAPQAENNDFCSPALVTPVKPIRFCPVCLTSMSWMPKFATCPKCGVKPMPVFEERLKEKKMTAEQILTDYLGKRPATIEDYCADSCDKAAQEKNPDNEEDQQTGCRCTCKYGKLCVHCRIRKLCADIFQSNGKLVTEAPKVEPRSSEDFCVINDKSEDSRPFLARVFSELRSLYNIHDSKRPLELEKQCNRNSFHKRNPPRTDASQIGEKTTRSVEERRKFNEQIPADQSKSKSVEHKRRIVHTGHKSCVDRRGAVSRRHGWDWTSSKEARKHGWRPGAILRPMKKIMNYFLNYSSEDNAFNCCQQLADEEKEKERQLPMLHMSKKNGELFITLRAVNNRNVEMKPIIFKVVKSDLAVILREIKRKLKADGFRKCTCHKSLLMCVCRNYREKRDLGYALEVECKRRGMETCVEDLVLTDTSDSEVEFDFDVTPPAGVAKPPPTKPRTVNHSTQTAKKDQKVKPMYPIKHSCKWRTYDCAAGDRYTCTAFGVPCEKVFEDGVFGYRGGGPHGESAHHGSRPKSKVIWGASCGGPTRSGSREKKSPSNAVKKPGAGGGGSELIPVRVSKRFLKLAEDALKAKKKAMEDEIERKKRGTNMIKYLKRMGKPVVGPDGLTGAQRRLRLCHQIPRPLIEMVPRLGRGCDQCTEECYDRPGVPPWFCSSEYYC